MQDALLHEIVTGDPLGAREGVPGIHSLNVDVEDAPDYAEEDGEDGEEESAEELEVNVA